MFLRFVKHRRLIILSILLIGLVLVSNLSPKPVAGIAACTNCEQSQVLANEICSMHGGLYSFSCPSNRPGYFYFRCNDGYSKYIAC